MPDILTIDLSTGTHKREEIDSADYILGGRALSSRLVKEKVPAVADPLGPDNNLYFCCGILAGTAISNANRLSSGAKSPLTGTIKESNSGGTFAYQMGRLRIRAIGLEGVPPQKNDWQIIVISEDKVRLESGAELVGHGTGKKAELLRARFGDTIGYVIIGPAGEHLMRSAAIAVSDPQLEPTRFCGRGGLGAVMASKRVQAVVIDAGGSSPLQPQDKELFKEVSRSVAQHVNSTPQTAKTFRNFGTAAMVDVAQGLGFLPVENFSRGRFEHAEKINGQYIHDTINERGGTGRASHACMPGCLIKCSNVYPDTAGNTLVSPLEYETIGMLGPNLGIADLDIVAELNAIANDCGIDTIDAGAAIGVAMQSGLASFGDSDAALSMMREIRQATILGKVLGAGAETAARVLGVYQVPTAKGQAFPAYDPRALKGLAATYATSPMGADHTAGHTIRSQVDDHHDHKGQAEASRQAQIGVLQWDALGFCYFLGTALPGLEPICDLVRAFFARQITPEQIRAMAVATLKAEREFNRDAGFGPAQDRLSEYFHKQANADTGTVCDIPDEDISDLMDDSKLSN